MYYQKVSPYLLNLQKQPMFHEKSTLMNDFVRIAFSNTEWGGKTLLGDSESLSQVLDHLHHANDDLTNTGLQGRFLDDLLARWGRIESALGIVADEMYETGQDLLIVVERFRCLDAECAALFYSQATNWLINLPAAGGLENPSMRLDHVERSIGAFQRIRADILKQLNEIDQQLDNPLYSTLYRLTGVHDDYESIRANLSASIAQIDNKLAVLQSEHEALQLAVEIAPPPLHGFAELIQSPATPLVLVVDPPPAPSQPSTIGDPQALEQYVHNQNLVKGDSHACSLYAQTGVMAAMGYDFNTELQNVRVLGSEDKWYTPGQGSSGLGQPFAAKGIPYETYGFDAHIESDAALNKLESELQAGHYPVVSLDATKLSIYKGTGVAGHTIWITGAELDANGETTHIIANDSFWGKSVSYPVGEFMNAWGSQFNYYAVFAQPK
jgi:hypothetical protein